MEDAKGHAQTPFIQPFLCKILARKHAEQRFKPVCNPER